MTAPTAVALEHEIGATGLLVIHGREGALHLHAVDGGTVRVHGRDELDAAADIERGAGSLSIRGGGDGIAREGHRRRMPDLAIDAPRRAAVVIETASGDITVEGLLGDQRYRTASGDIALRDVAGYLSIEALSGDVEASVVDDAEVTARTVSGDLTLRAGTITSLDASTTSGDLRIAARLAGLGPFSIETVSGDSLLALAGDIRIELQTVAGDIRSDVEARSEGGPGRRLVTIGTGGPTLRMRTMSGDVRVVRPSAVTRSGPAAPDAEPADGPTNAIDATDGDAARLTVLRALERGDIDVAEATRRLEALDGTADDASHVTTTTVPTTAATLPEEPTDA